MGRAAVREQLQELGIFGPDARAMARALDVLVDHEGHWKAVADLLGVSSVHFHETCRVLRHVRDGWEYGEPLA